MTLILAISFCLLMQALYNAAEIILVSADRYKLADLSRSGGRGAKTALELLDHPDRALALQRTTAANK